MHLISLDQDELKTILKLSGGPEEKFSSKKKNDKWRTDLFLYGYFISRATALRSILFLFVNNPVVDFFPSI